MRESYMHSRPRRWGHRISSLSGRMEMSIRVTKPFHIGYRTGFVISNPNADPLTVEITFYASEGRTTNVVMSDGAGAVRVVPPRATVNLTTPAGWRTPQRFGYVTVSGNLQFFMTVQVELVHIQNPAVPSATAVDPRVSVMRMEAAKSTDRKSTRLNSSHIQKSRMPSSA